jgi:PAS domain S-box-containing protein
MNFPIVILLFATSIAVLITFFTLRNLKSSGALSLIVFSLAITVWMVSYVLQWAGVQFRGDMLISLIFLGATIAPTALFTFTIAYTHRNHLLTRSNLALLAIEPIATQILIWTNPAHHLFFLPEQNLAGQIAGPWFWMNALYTNGLVLIGVFLLSQTFVYKRQVYRLQSGIVLVGTVIPVIVSSMSLANISLIPGFDLKPVAFTVTALLFSYGLFYRGMLDIVPIARDIVVERMSDGWMMLDTENRIVDMNSAAEKVIGIPREKIFGSPAETILSNWDSLTQNNMREMEVRGSVNLGDEWRFLNVRIEPLIDQSGREIGKTIFWRDLTERRKLEESRQRARTEMFVLLHAISGAASRALNLNEFLSESLYQIVYSFQSQASVVFLLDEGQERSESRRLLLAAHHGFLSERINQMSSITEDNAIVEKVLASRKPLLIPDVSADERVPPMMQQEGASALLIVPLIIEQQILGILGLMRKDNPVYSPDEITRLTVVAEELAASIYGDRRRQLAIALAERQRLVRDLHDSVTQKLYGLVTLTEAAQAGLETSAESGSADKLKPVISRIGENARQALKEMRLFLHEMQPIDLEREGLIAALHQRLAAVEGRSDVKANMLAEEDVPLSLEKQVALYFIAQEALNNILKHASAKSVSVQVKRTKENVILDVQDDGCGFTLGKDSRGGMGLRNMKERATLVGGRLKITTAPGQGTKISVSVRKDHTL